MKLLLEWMKNSKNWFKTQLVCIQKGLPLGEVKTNMASRVIEDISEAPPSKKPCISEENGEAQPKKIKNKKVALLLAYLGGDYCGLQVNNGVRTVEGELLSALNKAGVINPAGFTEPYTIQFQRTARTDKGVSAAKQVISLKMAEKFCIDSINKYLPEDIKLLSAKKVTKGFNCKNDCTARTYSYTLPTFALAPELHVEYPQKYRINEDTVKKANEILESYKGTRNFHNFTVKKNFTDPSVRRYIMNIDTEKPFLHGEEEFVTIRIKGQSFMFHQIRKMIGHMIAVLKGMVSEDIQTDVWNSTKYSVPLAPGLGLVLEDVHFDHYDRKFGNDGIHETLKWNEVADEVNSFRSYILSNIIKKEIEGKSMYNWLLLLSSHSYDPDTKKTFENSEEPEEISEEQIVDKKTPAASAANSL